MKGKISLTFDDGWKCIYDNAFPILSQYKITSTHFVVSGFFDSVQFPQYMNVEHVRELERNGHEVGCHTVSHKHLPEETASIIQNEVTLSKKYMSDLGLKITNFAYPYGEYDDRVLASVKNAGYSSARSTIRGFNAEEVDKYLLRCQAVKVDTEVKEVIDWLNCAKENNSWLILMFHQIDHEGREWSTTPEKLKEIVSFIRSSNVSVYNIRDALLENESTAKVHSI